VFPAEFRLGYTAEQNKAQSSSLRQWRPGGPPPDDAAVGEHPKSSVARRPSMLRPWATSRNLTLEVGPQRNRQNLPQANLQNLTLSAQQSETPTILERSESALGNIGQFGSPRPPSLSPHQTTGSYGAPSPAIGSDIDEYFPVSKTVKYRPSLLEI